MKNLYECVSNGDVLTNRELIDLVHDRGLITDVQWATLSYKHHLNKDEDEDIIIEYLESLDDPLKLIKDPEAIASKILAESSDPLRIIEDADVVRGLTVREIADMLEGISRHTDLMKELVDRWVD